MKCITRNLVCLLFALFSLSAFSATKISPVHPDPKETPGELCTRNDADFDGYRYKEKIPFCVRNVTSTTKTQIYDYYKVPESQRRFYTIDHFIPLSIGGSNSVENLWPEHKKIKALRQNLEEEIYVAVNAGTMTQEDAILKITEAKMNPPLSK